MNRNKMNIVIFIIFLIEGYLFYQNRVQHKINNEFLNLHEGEVKIIWDTKQSLLEHEMKLKAIMSEQIERLNNDSITYSLYDIISPLSELKKTDE